MGFFDGVEGGNVAPALCVADFLPLSRVAAYQAPPPPAATTTAPAIPASTRRRPGFGEPPEPGPDAEGEAVVPDGAADAGDVARC